MKKKILLLLFVMFLNGKIHADEDMNGNIYTQAVEFSNQEQFNYVFQFIYKDLVNNRYKEKILSSENRNDSYGVTRLS